MYLQTTVFKPFFISLNLPYSVIRGEEFALQVNVFNYLKKDVNVSIQTQFICVFCKFFIFTHISGSTECILPFNIWDIQETHDVKAIFLNAKFSINCKLYNVGMTAQIAYAYAPF